MGYTCSKRIDVIKTGVTMLLKICLTMLLKTFATNLLKQVLKCY